MGIQIVEQARANLYEKVPEIKNLTPPQHSRFVEFNKEMAIFVANPANKFYPQVKATMAQIFSDMEDWQFEHLTMSQIINDVYVKAVEQHGL